MLGFIAKLLKKKIKTKKVDTRAAKPVMYTSDDFKGARIRPASDEAFLLASIDNTFSKHHDMFDLFEEDDYDY